MATIDLIQMLSELNPTTAEIAQSLWAFGKLPDNVLRAVVSSLDETMIRKIARWSKTFMQHMNDLGSAAVDPDALIASLKEDGSNDFLSVMGNTKFIGPTLTMEVIDAASNEMTKAVKAANWQDAVWTGISLAKYLPVAAA